MSRRRKSKKKGKRKKDREFDEEVEGEEEVKAEFEEKVLNIGCDIGDVLRDMSQREDSEGLKFPIPNSVKMIRRLSRRHNVIIISKAKNQFIKESIKWLKKYELIDLQRYFVRENEDKIATAKQQKLDLDVMIDDTLPVLRTFLDAKYSCKLVWFTWKWRDNPEHIRKTKQYHEELVNSVRLAKNWNEVGNIIQEMLD